jgi:hypothetical protein
MRLAHHAAEQQARETAVPAPSPQPRPESHTEAMAASHEGCPTAAQQKDREWYP